MSFLARHYEVVSPSQLVSGNFAKHAAMVSIDDCHRDTYEYIFPVAQSLGIPITTCVPTDYFLRNRWLWFDMLYWMLERTTAGRTIVLEGRTWQTGDVESIAGLKEFLKRQTPVERDSNVGAIARQLGLLPPPMPVDGYEPVSQSEMRDMLASGLVEICAHTVTHTIATALPDNAFRAELKQCKDELEAYSGREVRSFCYPNGDRGDFDERTKLAVRQAGFRLALTSVPGINRRDDYDPYRILRIHAHGHKSTFEKDASGLGEWQHRLRGSMNSSIPK